MVNRTNNNNSIPSASSASSTSASLNEQSTSSSLHPISCNRCRSRHTKCDKLLPTCSYCMENNLECIYETPKKLRKNYLAEFVDLNQNNVVSSALTSNLQNPQSKYKIYKFSVGEKKKKKRKERIGKSDENLVVSTSLSTLENMDSSYPDENTVQVLSRVHSHAPITLHASSSVAQQRNNNVEMSFVLGLMNHLDERLLLKAFRTDAYTYYTQYIAFGTTLLSEKTIERVYEFVDEDNMTQLYPEDVLALIYAIHAVNLYVFEQRDVSSRSFEKSLRLLQYDPSSIGNILSDVAAIRSSEGSGVLCLSSDQNNSDVYFSNNRDHNSLFLISSRMMLSQYCLCLGYIPTATYFLQEADIMLKNRFPNYRNQSHLPSSILGVMVEPVNSLYQGLSPDEIFVLKYRLICGVKLDDIRFFQERVSQYIGYSTPQSFENYTRTSSVLSDDPKYLFSSYVNKYIFGTALFIIGMGKKDLLNLLLSPNVILKDQPNIPFMIIGVLDFNGKLLKKLTAEKFNMTESEANAIVVPTEITHRYSDLVFTFQKIFTTSYSFLVLHEVVINYSSPFTLMNSNRTDIDIDKVKNCLTFRNEFADELSDLYAVLPDYTIHYISLVVITVFLVTKIHYDRLLESGTNIERKLLVRLKNDFRVLHLLRRKFPQLFEYSHLSAFYNAIERKINQLLIF